MFQSSAAQRGFLGLLHTWSRTLKTPRCPHHASRSLCVPPATPARDEASPPLRRWSRAVSPFSTVRTQLGCSVSVRPLDPHAFPEADRAFVAVHGAEPGAELEDLLIRYDEQEKELLISAEKVDASVTIDVEAPIKSNLFLTAHGSGNVQVKSMECDTCMVQTERGNCLLHSIRSHRVEVQSHGGDVTGLGTIHGNVDIGTRGDGTVNVKKLQGTRMSVSTEHGLLKVKAIYAQSSCLSSSSGKVELGHVHGEATVKSGSGDILIDGSNSSLKVSSQSGNIDVYMGDGASAELHSLKGSVCVRVPSSLRAGVELHGVSVDVSPEVVLHGLETNTTEGQTTVTGHVNEELPVEQQVKARADGGSVTLKTQSWFESLKLGG